MADIAPIPLNLLTDSIVVTEHVSATRHQAQPTPPEHKFERVRVQPADKRQIVGGSGEAAQLQDIGNYLVFIDATNSVNPDGYQIKLGDTVLWEGRPRQVTQVNPMKALLPTPHHWEVWLA